MNLYSYEDNAGLVLAENEEEALTIIRTNRASWYTGPVVFVREDNGRYTWDELYALAMNTGFGNAWLRWKDAARAWFRDYILQQTGEDIEETECPEEAIDRYLQEKGEVVFRLD